MISLECSADNCLRNNYNCSPFDYQCLCANNQWVSEARSCFGQHCNGDDLAHATRSASSYCTDAVSFFYVRVSSMSSPLYFYRASPMLGRSADFLYSDSKSIPSPISYPSIQSFFSCPWTLVVIRHTTIFYFAIFYLSFLFVLVADTAITIFTPSQCDNNPNLTLNDCIKDDFLDYNNLY